MKTEARVRAADCPKVTWLLVEEFLRTLSSHPYTLRGLKGHVNQLVQFPMHPFASCVA